MAAMQGPLLMGYVVVLYASTHFLEGNIINPLVQAEAVQLPPVLTLFAALVFRRRVVGRSARRRPARRG